LQQKTSSWEDLDTASIQEATSFWRWYRNTLYSCNNTCINTGRCSCWQFSIV